MNQQYPQSALTPTSASSVPQHLVPTDQELLELGMLAIEDANLSEGGSAPVIATSSPASPQPQPQPLPGSRPADPHVPTVSDTQHPGVVASSPMPSQPTTTLHIEGDEALPAPPTTVVQPTAQASTRPTPADGRNTQKTDPGPDAWDTAASAALPGKPSAPKRPVGVPSLTPIDIMEYSANSSQLKNISKLRRVSIIFYFIIIGLAFAIVGAGYYAYTQLSTAF